MPLTWEWAAERTPTSRILVEVSQIRKEGGGLFGLKKSPSIIENVPDGHILTGVVVLGDHVGRSVSLRMPGFEIPDISEGDRVGLGLIGEGICICVVPLPAGLSDSQLEDWLGAFRCES